MNFKIKTLSQIEGKAGTYVEAHDWCPNKYFAPKGKKSLRRSPL